MATMDALKMFKGPIIELRISNTHRHEPVHHRSLVSPVETAVIAGLGTMGYAVAVRSVLQLQAALGGFVALSRSLAAEANNPVTSR